MFLTEKKTVFFSVFSISLSSTIYAKLDRIQDSDPENPIRVPARSGSAALRCISHKQTEEEINILKLALYRNPVPPPPTHLLGNKIHFNVSFFVAKIYTVE